MKKKLLKGLLFFLLLLVWGFGIGQPVALAQGTFPTKPVTIWVGFPAGGSTDVITRVLSEEAEKILGQRIVVVNKPGGGGAVAASLMTKEKPDGYILGATTDTPFTRTPHTMDLDFDPLRDLSHIVRVVLWKNAIGVKADSPFKTWQDVVDWAKKNPGQLVCGHSGVGTTTHLALYRLAKKEGFTFKDVPFAGEMPNVTALLGGHTMISSNGHFRSHVEAKKVRVLLVFEKEGLDFAPDAPTLEKAGYDFEIPTSVIFFAPKGIPDSTREILEKAFIDGMKQEKFRKMAKDYELILAEPLTGKALSDYIRKWYSIYEKYIKEAGIYKKIEKK